VSRRKTAQRGPAKKAEPESKVRWLIINKETGQPTFGCWNALRHGISTKDKAEQEARHLVLETEVVAVHTFFNKPNPDEEAE
jgi:hypothetical protein